MVDLPGWELGRIRLNGEAVDRASFVQILGKLEVLAEARASLRYS